MKLQKFGTITLIILYYLIFCIIDVPVGVMAAEDQLFELPVQLIGFPVIIFSVRLANFFKKLGYSLNPSTYKARSRRSVLDGYPEGYFKHVVDAAIAEKKILKEFGPKVCIFEEPCRLHAARPGKVGEQPDWNEILRNYKVQSTEMKQWYLLSVFLGDVIRDVQLCKQLAKRIKCGRS